MPHLTVNRLVTCVAFACASGCAEPPPLPPDTFDFGTTGYVDHVIGFTSGGVPTSCAQMGATDCPHAVPPFPCAAGGQDANVVLDAPDGKTFPLNSMDKIEAAFLCSIVIEHSDATGTPVPSLQIFATLDAGASGVVEVSYDGSAYDTLDRLDVDNKTFSLSRSSLHVIRFVRITNVGGQGAIHVDALQGL